MARRIVASLGLLFALLTYGPALWACPVCFAAKNEENRTAFIVTTGFLTFLPLSLVGGGVWWLRRRARDEVESLGRLPKPRREPAASAASEPILEGFEDMPPTG